MSVAIKGIPTDFEYLGKMLGRVPANPLLLNLLAIGGQTDCALGLMPPEVDATTYFVCDLLVIVHGVYLRFPVKLLRGEWDLLVSTLLNAYVSTSSPPIVVLKVGKLWRRHETEPLFTGWRGPRGP